MITRRIKTGAVSPMLRAYQREIFACFEHALAAVLADDTAAPSDAVEPFIAAAALSASSGSTSKAATATPNRSGTAPSALDLLEHGLADYAIAPTPGPANTNAGP